MVDIIGIVAGVFIFASLTFKCITIKSNILMRILNTIGSALFVAYGAILWANGGNGWSLVACNGLLVLFNGYHIIRLALSLKKQPVENSQLPKTDGEGSSEQPSASETEDADVLSKVKALAEKCDTIEELRAALNDVK